MEVWLRVDIVHIHDPYQKYTCIFYTTHTISINVSVNRYRKCATLDLFGYITTRYNVCFLEHNKKYRCNRYKVFSMLLYASIKFGNTEFRSPFLT